MSDPYQHYYISQPLYWVEVNRKNVDLSCRRGGVDMKQVAKTLSDPDLTIKSIDLRWNEIDDEGAIVLAGALKSNTTLTTLQLRWNDIDNDGARALADALKANKALTTLNLRGNEIGNDGAIALADALKTNRTLTTLELDMNEIDNDGVKDTIQQLLEKNKYRDRLDSVVSAFVLSSGSISELVDVLLENEHTESSLSITFDLLRIRMDWATSTSASL